MRPLLQSTALKICVLVVAVLLVGAVTAAELRTTPVNALMSFLLSPVQRLSAAMADRLDYFNISFRSSALLAREIAAREAEIEALKEQLVDLEKMKQQNEMFRDSLGLKEENKDFRFEEASIIGRDAVQQVYWSFSLNKGSRHGVRAKDPVVYGKNLIGVVTEVTLLQCTVKTLLHPDVNVAAYELSTGDTGYVTTTTELSYQGLCRMPGLDNKTAIAPGGIVCTSGTTGNYPRGLIIGTVQEVLDDSLDISSYAVIKPSAAFADIKDVLIITGFEGQLNRAEEAE